jgi:hypothetical protein
LRIHWQPREKAAVVYLRKHHHYSMNQLAIFFGRSVSLIHQILNFNKLIGNLPYESLRKLPNQTRKLHAQIVRLTMDKWVSAWEAFILGEVDRPP